jgi:tetratricopeptide (TPR) repeat protein
MCGSQTGFNSSGLFGRGMRATVFHKDAPSSSEDRKEAAKRKFVKGLSRLKEKDYDRAADCLQQANELFPENPFIASYLGLALVLIGMPERGIDLCEESRRKNPYHEDLLFNLGQAHRYAGNRSEARKAFLLGAKGCLDTQRFIEALREMGVRRKPVISFLSRDNILNRWLGRLTYKPGQFRLEDIEN